MYACKVSSHALPPLHALPPFLMLDLPGENWNNREYFRITS